MTDVQAAASQPSLLPSASAPCPWQELLLPTVTEPPKILPLRTRFSLSRQHTPGHGRPPCRESQTAIQGAVGQKGGHWLSWCGEPAWFPLPSIFQIKILGLCSYLYLRQKSSATLRKEKLQQLQIRWANTLHIPQEFPWGWKSSNNKPGKEWSRAPQASVEKPPTLTTHAVCKKGFYQLQPESTFKHKKRPRNVGNSNTLL